MFYYFVRVLDVFWMNESIKKTHFFGFKETSICENYFKINLRKANNEKIQICCQKRKTEGS